MTETFVLESHHDRLLLHGLVVRPKQEPCRGILQVAHGMCEHKERYLPFLQEMADHGYLCWTSAAWLGHFWAVQSTMCRC